MIEPNYGYCVILSEPEQLGQGIIVSPSERVSPYVGKVLAVKHLDGAKTVFTEGDTVVFDKYSATHVELDGNTYRIAKNENIFGRVIDSKREAPPLPNPTNIDHQLHESDPYRLDRSVDIVRNKYRDGPNPADRWRG